MMMAMGGELAFIEGRSRTRGSKPTTISRPPEQYSHCHEHDRHRHRHRHHCRGSVWGGCPGFKGEMDFCRGVIGKRDGGRVQIRCGTHHPHHLMVVSLPSC